MFDLSVSIVELIVRAFAVYIFLFVLLRVLGKKHVGELSPFDLLILLIISESVSSALSGGDNSLIGGFISAATLIGTVRAVTFVSSRNKRVERFLEGTPKVLVRHGATDRAAMAEQQITMMELLEALRQNGNANIRDVKTAVLENDGKISFTMRKK